MVAGTNVLIVEIVHEQPDHMIDIVRSLKQHFPRVPVIAGEVVTARCVSEQVEAGADAVKVGVGSGLICTTRIVTGFGITQISAISEFTNAG